MFGRKRWTMLNFSESTGNGQSGHRRLEKRQGLPTKIPQKCSNSRGNRRFDFPDFRE